MSSPDLGRNDNGFPTRSSSRPDKLQILATVGEPEVGKSRLFDEFKATSQAGCIALEASRSPMVRPQLICRLSTYSATIFDFSTGDDERKRREKVTGSVVALDRSLEDICHTCS